MFVILLGVGTKSKQDFTSNPVLQPKTLVSHSCQMRVVSIGCGSACCSGFHKKMQPTAAEKLKLNQLSKKCSPTSCCGGQSHILVIRRTCYLAWISTTERTLGTFILSSIKFHFTLAWPFPHFRTP